MSNEYDPEVHDEYEPSEHTFHVDAHPEAKAPVGDRNYGKWGQCVSDSNTTGDRCGGVAKGPHGKCYSHGGGTPTKEENEDVGAPEGNDNAVGNDGGAPNRNQNAMESGLRSDPRNLFDWLIKEDEAGAAYILSKLHDYSEYAPRPVFIVELDPDDVDSFEDATRKLTAYGDDILTTCVRDYARKRAEHIQLKEGLITEQTRQSDAGPYTVRDSNPINVDLNRFDRGQLSRKDKLGLLPDDGADVEVNISGAMWDSLTEYYAE